MSLIADPQQPPEAEPPPPVRAAFGGTLDTANGRANFVSRWRGRKINVHVDLPG